ncbi:c-type cytochrome [Kordiimonas sp.]|uniref:c-type cytochrome n=1 Tax=Kordiimonas sp. TaxID=1970157 RepID=UPI003A90AA2E
MRFFTFFLWLVLTSSVHANVTYSSIVRGEAVFARCVNCHTIAPGEPDRIGPNLYGIMGRRIASLQDYDYSPALSAVDGVWSPGKLDNFLSHPNHAVAGTDMSYRGIQNPGDREDLINWLATQGPGSRSTPVSDHLQESLMQGDAAHGWKLFQPCTACHSYQEGAPNKIGPNLYGIVGRPIASANGFSYGERIIRLKGVWTPERLNAFMFESKKFDQGSHLAFQRLIELSDRADLIAWLQTISPEGEWGPISADK